MFINWQVSFLLRRKSGLKSQLTRASVLIPSNIAEGSAKATKKEYRHFLKTSLTSVFEVATKVLIIERLTYEKKDLRDKVLLSIDEEQKMLMSFIQTIG